MKLKVCIFEQLGCENEVDFICKSLNALYPSLSVESTSIIKNTAIEIGDSQIISNVNNNGNTNRITLCNYIQQQYNDRLSKLHSDIIDYFGAFLSKKESIEFGYLNKQLYIETQKESYLLKRSKGETFYLNDDIIERIMSTNGNIFNYSFPSNLTLEISERQRQCISNIVCFDNCFGRLNRLHCFNLFSLSCVPIATVFDCNNNLFSDQESKDKLKEFLIEDAWCDREMKKNVEKLESFVSKFNEYKNNHDKMRQIDMLTLNFEHMNSSIDSSHYENSIKQILIACSCICSRIYMREISLVIKTLNELENIFNENVEELMLHHSARIVFDLDENINDEDDEVFGMLDILRCVLRGNSATEEKNKFLYDMITWFDRFSMRKPIRYYSLEWKPSFGYCDRDRDSSILCQSIAIFDQFLKENYSDKHPLLETVLIKLKDRYDLSGFARLLMYFNNNYEKLFVEKLGLEDFQSIVIYFEELQWDVGIGNLPNILNCVPRLRQPETNYENELIFAQKKNEKLFNRHQRD